MPVAAFHWQRRLQAHFSTLAAKGKSAGRSIFAIEHGLSTTEIEELRFAARAELALEGLRPDHWLMWVVYAAEYGYGFNGLQFWEDFGDQTPDWHLKGDRQTIRDWFRRFQSEFGGIRPRGRWASHFSIIAWPITHAILPKDLQRQLARALYEAQYKLRRVFGSPPVEVARVLANTVHTGSQRFLLFLEQEELVGQIVVSLLGSPDELTRGIEPTILARISHDLGSMRDARDWVNQAQKTWRTAKPQFKISGSASGGAAHTPLCSTDNSQPFRAISLFPSIDAQHTARNGWLFEVTIPSFSNVAALNPQFRDFLRSTRVSVPSAGTPMLPGDWLLIGVRKRILKSWPTDGEGLIQFEAAPPFDGLVDWNLALPNSKVWAFKLQRDGTARLLRGNRLRAGCSYLIVARNSLDLKALGPPSKCHCGGISVYRIDLPNVVEPGIHTLLETIGLQCAQSITLSVAGIPPLQWDPDSGGEWLSSNRPMFSLARDHKFDGYRLSLNDDDIVEFSAEQLGAVLIELPELSPGTHNFSIQTFTVHRDRHIATKRIQATQSLKIIIRDPKPWISGEINYPGMFVSCSPLNPSIEDFLAGQLSLDVLGESSVRSTITIILKGSAEEQTWSRTIVDHNLPISHEIWKACYQEFLRKSTAAQEYHTCSAAYMDISSCNFGSYRIQLDRQFSPLRWMLTRKDSRPIIRLIDYGAVEGVHASFSGFNSPLTDIPLTPNALQGGIDIPLPGGLFRARAGDLSSDTIFAPADIKGLAALHVPFASNILSEAVDPGSLLERCAIWNHARPLTYLAKFWQKQLVKLFFDCVISIYCGQRWLDAEHALQDQPDEDRCWRNLESLISENSITYGIALGKADIGPNAQLDEVKALLFSITRRYKIIVDYSILDLIWKLAWFDDLDEPLNADQLMIIGPYGRLIRAARLMRLRLRYRRLSAA